MGWSLSWRKLRNPELVDAVMLIGGKALYLANAFEYKCQYLLRIRNLTESLQNDPVIALEEAIAALPRDKMLGATLIDLSKGHPFGGKEHLDRLAKAREARNYIAHQGAIDEA